MTKPLALFLFLFFLVPSFADNWERFRGPNGSGTSEDAKIPVAFGPKENLRWKVVLPGTGNSSPIVWGGRLFLHASAKDGSTRSLLCYDADTGKLHWQKDIAGSLVTIRADSSLASSTPTTDGETVYVSFWNGKEVIVHAYDFQGEKRWETNLGLFNSQHGPGASPILYKDLLLLAHDMDKDDFTTKKPNDRPSNLIALDKRTGKKRWETPRTAERTCYSAPFFRKVPGREEPELIVMSTTAITGYDPATGKKRWESAGWQQGVKGPLRTVASPALGDILCATSGGDAGRYAIGLSLPSGGSEEQPRTLWENRKDFPYVASPLAHGDHVYFVNDAGYAGCFEARTGKRVWLERVSDVGFHASPLLIAGKIYASNSAGDLFVWPAETTYRLVARNEFGEPLRTTGAVAGGRLYLRGDRHLFCIAGAK